MGELAINYKKLVGPLSRVQAVDSPRLHDVEYSLGLRGEDFTEVHVRGFVIVEYKVGGRARSVPFAGSTVIREGRGVPTHDLRIMDSDLYDHAALLESIAIELHLLMDEFAEDFVSAEMTRICGE